MVKEIRKAVIPAAGLGTRLYPATKAQAKEMLPLGLKPVIQMVAEELVASGIREILIVTGRKKRAIEDHFDPNQGELEQQDNNSWAHQWEQLGVRFYYTRQSQPRGLGHAILQAQDFAGGDDFVVALGDCAIIGSPQPVTQRLVLAHLQQTPSATIAVQKVDAAQTDKYGIVKLSEPQSEPLRLADIVEKPGPQQAPSNLAVCARYIFSPAIFSHLQATTPGYGGEIQLTDAIRALLAAGGQVYAVLLEEEELRLDVGNVNSYSQAFVRAVLDHPQVGSQFAEYLRQLVAHLEEPDNPNPIGTAVRGT